MAQPNEGEIEFIRSGLLSNIRSDGRSNKDRQTPEITTGILNNCNGSSLLETDSLKIYTGIKLEIGVPTKSSPKEGILNIRIDSMKKGQKFDRHKTESLDTDKSRILYLESLISQYLFKFIDKRSLQIIDGKKCWVLQVEVFLLTHSNEQNIYKVQEGLIDFIYQSVRAALQDLQIPEISITHNHLLNEDEFELIGDQFHGIQFQLPTMQTIGIIGAELVLDLSRDEYFSVDKLFLVITMKTAVIFIQSFEQNEPTPCHPEEFMKICEYLKHIQQKD